MLLLRLGGFSVGFFRGTALVDSKTDQRFVKNRHRKGGQSQRRFDRIREKQVDELFGKACETARETLAQYEAEIEHLFFGGDRHTLQAFHKECSYFERFGARVMQRVLPVPGDPRRASLDAIPREVWSSEIYVVRVDATAPVTDPTKARQTRRARPAYNGSKHSPPAGGRSEETSMLSVGQEAPDFDLEDESGNRVRLADFRGKSAVVLMFYPADLTPGCTKQLCAARDDYDKYQAAGIAVFGVNPGSAGTHKKFIDKHNLRTPLLLDRGGKVSRAYDALMPIPIVTVVNRTVAGIDRDGVIRFYERGMPSTSTIMDAMGAAAPA